MTIVQIVEAITFVVFGILILSMVDKMGKAQCVEDNGESTKETWRQFWTIVAVFMAWILAFELGSLAQMLDDIMRNRNV